MPNFSVGPILASVASQEFLPGVPEWSNPNNALVDDGSSYADVNLVAPHQGLGQVLKVSQYGFTIPPIATILGIQFSQIIFATPDPTDHLTILFNVYKGGAFLTQLFMGGEFTTTPTTYVWGGPSELFGTTWLYSDINDAGFGQGIQPEADISMDVRSAAFYATVYYQENAGSPSNGGVTAFERIGLYPMSDGNLYAFDPNAGYNDPLDGSSYFWRVEEIAVGRKPTIDRLFVTYRDLGKVTTRWTMTGVQDDQTVVTQTAIAIFGNDVPTGYLMTAQVFLPVISGMNMQLSVTRLAGAGPLAISKVKMCGTVEMNSNS